ncbi:MAG: DNA adenine methylase, partial [Waterburya sp.]
MSQLKSPLRYPGGKSKVVDIITARFPKDIDVLVSPFIGGGSVELWASQNGIKVYAYDGFEPLVNFWKMLLT